MTASLHTLMPATVETWHNDKSEWHTPSIVWDRTGEKIHLEEVRNIVGKQLRKFAEDMRIRSASLNEELSCALQAHDGLGPYQQLAAQELRVKIKRIRQLRDRFRRFLNEANIEIADRRDRRREEEEVRSLQLAQAKLALNESTRAAQELSQHDMLSKYCGRRKTVAFFALVRAMVGEDEVERLEIAAQATALEELATWADTSGIEPDLTANYIEKAQKELHRRRKKLAASIPSSQTAS
jgi:molybdopterin converting factor small subunit